ncbi:RDD family protein [Chitinophaga cymbidii]|nr:RDD family protein [Chitinophaga cymbidii]
MNASTRLGSMLLDHFIMVMICMIFFIPTTVTMFSSFAPGGENVPWVPLQHRPMFYFSLLGFAIYFCKDSINGRSIAKRILKMQVVDNRTGRPASPLQCVVRNLFCILWPVEVLVTFGSPDRRIGDMVAGTRVDEFDPANVAQGKSSLKMLITGLLFAYGVILLITMVMALLTPSLPA